MSGLAGREQLVCAHSNLLEDKHKLARLLFVSGRAFTQMGISTCVWALALMLQL